MYKDVLFLVETLNKFLNGQTCETLFIVLRYYIITCFNMQTHDTQNLSEELEI